MLSAIFDVALGLILVFLVLSIVASSVSEYLGNMLQRRAWNLERFLEGVLVGTGINLFEDFYNRTLISTLSQNGHRPSYLKSEDFAQALIDILTYKFLPKDSPAAQAMATADPSLEEWGQIVYSLWNDKIKITDQMHRLSWQEHLQRFIRRLRSIAPPSIGNKLPLAEVLSAMVNQAYGDEQKIRKQIETWYDNSMNRVSGWYKGQTQIILLLIGIALAAVLNIDTISISNSLLQNPAVRAVVDDAAKNMGNSTAGAPTTPEQVNTYLQKLNLPIGWPDPGMPANPGSEWWLHKLLGILITGFAVSQGAPFWFDLLNKITNLRSGGVAPATAQQSAVQSATTNSAIAQATTAVAQANTAQSQADTAQAQAVQAQSATVTAPITSDATAAVPSTVAVSVPVTPIPGTAPLANSSNTPGGPELTTVTVSPNGATTQQNMAADSAMGAGMPPAATTPAVPPTPQNPGLG